MTSSARAETIAANYQAVQARIAAACKAAGRDSSEVTLLPVTKLKPLSDVQIAYDLGITTVGENREQEAKAKAAALPGLKVHLIGSLQTNKANSAARFAHTVQSVDSLRLVTALVRGAQLALDRGDRTTKLAVYLQLSLDGDPARGGATAEQLPELAAAVAASSSLTLAGLMCVPPVAADPAAAFATAHQEYVKLQAQYDSVQVFSAGMSGDLETAILKGSTMVRVGTDIFGQRN